MTSDGAVRAGVMVRGTEVQVDRRRMRKNVLEVEAADDRLAEEVCTNEVSLAIRDDSFDSIR